MNAETALPEPSPCPLCKQYSHSLGEDQIAEAFNHFQTMFSHRGDGIPTQFCFDEKTRDAAQVLMAAATRPHPDLPGDVVVERWKGETYLDLSEARNPGTDDYAKGFNEGIIAARELAYAKLPELTAALTAALPNLKAVREALEPFAREAQSFPSLIPDDREIGICTDPNVDLSIAKFNVGDLRKLAEVFRSLLPSDSQTQTGDAR